MTSALCASVAVRVAGVILFKPDQSDSRISPATIPAPGMNEDANLKKHSCLWS
jgi:hypothetical protein